jgi:hypothetical protein
MGNKIRLNKTRVAKKIFSSKPEGSKKMGRTTQQTINIW